MGTRMGSFSRLCSVGGWGVNKIIKNGGRVEKSRRVDGAHTTCQLFKIDG